MEEEYIKQFEKKIYIKCGAFIITGILLIALGWKWKSIWADVLVVGGCLIVVIALIVFSAMFDTLYKVKGKIREGKTGEEFKETYIEWPGWIKKYGWLLYFILLLPGYFFAKKHENDFEGNSFLWHSVIAGIFLGLLTYQLLKLKFTNWVDNKNKKAEVLFYFILSGIIVCTCTGPPVNIYFAKGKADCKLYQLNKYGKNHKTGTKYLHVKVGDVEERFNPPNDFFKKLTSNDSLIILCVKKGFLGYKFVEEFKLP